MLPGQARRTAGAEQADGTRFDPGQDLLVGVEADDAGVAEDEGVDRLALGLVAESRDRLLVRNRDVRARVPARDQTPDRRFQPAGLDVERDVRPVERPGGEGRVLHARRERAGDRVPEQRDQFCGAVDHG